MPIFCPALFRISLLTFHSWSPKKKRATGLLR
nr:MAG TPA: hypothetical protein [Caudoviricetes sp.]